jgi:hypothetical protein
MLCGVGPTWLAIDGLDEVPHGLRTDWERALGALTALPNLTLLVTVRREVLAVREWLINVTAPLARVEIYMEMLQQQAPWWEDRIIAALKRLSEPPPAEHASRATDHLSWDPNRARKVFGAAKNRRGPRGGFRRAGRRKARIAFVGVEVCSDEQSCLL